MYLEKDNCLCDFHYFSSDKLALASNILYNISQLQFVLKVSIFNFPKIGPQAEKQFKSSFDLLELNWII